MVAATSELNRVVTNGMSQYSRNERNANAGIVVGITPEVDYPDGPLAGVALQEQLESQAFVLGGSTYEAPGQLVGDFLAGRTSTALGSVVPSYKPGVKLGGEIWAAPCRPSPSRRSARHRPRSAASARGFDAPEAVLDGIETRTGLAAAHHARRRPAEPQREGLVPGRRRCGLRRRHPVGGR